MAQAKVKSYGNEMSHPLMVRHGKILIENIQILQKMPETLDLA
jgi:hypothetical protein